jgi:ubiquinone/menaquinone biosynthesis C-methylase UbiE
VRKPEISDFQAQIGLTHHPGEMAATVRLMELAGIKSGERVLEVGCGAGITAVKLASFGCRVFALDRSERMVARTRQRLARTGLVHRAHVRRGEVEELPYTSDGFDIVLGEAVLIQVQDRARALRECRRVLRPGGVLALNEPTWLRSGPPLEVISWAHSAPDASGALTAPAWAALLADAGFESQHVELYRINPHTERLELIRRYGFKDILAAGIRRLELWIRSRDYRKYGKAARAKGPAPSAACDYLGYGLCICRKPA